jgi:hypothetical protein
MTKFGLLISKYIFVQYHICAFYKVWTSNCKVHIYSLCLFAFNCTIDINVNVFAAEYTPFPPPLPPHVSARSERTSWSD